MLLDTLSPHRISFALAATIWLCVAPALKAQDTGFPLPRTKPEAPAFGASPYPRPRAKPLRPFERRTAEEQPGPQPRARETAAARSDETSDPPKPSPPPSWSLSQIEAAKGACARLLKGLSLTYEPLEPVGTAGGCGIAAPVKVTTVGKAHPVRIKPAATLNCKLTAALVKWVDGHLQPVARREFKEPVKRIQNVSSYVCRRRNNSPNGKLSEHALGNALDIAAFTLKSGKTVTVKAGWRRQEHTSVVDDIAASIISPATPDSKFLGAAHKSACKVFSTILGPDANAAHHDHFHFDLGRGGRYIMCE